MADKALEFVDESEEPQSGRAAAHGRLTGWETVVFLIGAIDEDAVTEAGGAREVNA